MFASTKEKKPATTAGSAAASLSKDGGQTTVIAKGTEIKGEFICSENVRLDGNIKGEVRVEKRIVIGDTSVVEGNIHAKDAVIQGKIKGDLFIKESLQLMESAVIEGNIHAKTMVVEEGARYNGSCKIGSQSA